ncbi:GntR family transcriptional regulator [Salipiger sp. HF18]|nr:GntR family transcriptional regulator [Salipiger sp. HF18]
MKSVQQQEDRFRGGDDFSRHAGAQPGADPGGGDRRRTARGIEAGSFAPGDRLPSEFELTRRHSGRRTVVREARIDRAHEEVAKCFDTGVSTHGAANTFHYINSLAS